MTEPRTRRRPTKLSAETKWEIFLQVTAGEITQAAEWIDRDHVHEGERHGIDGEVPA